MNDSVEWWLGGLYAQFYKNRDALQELDLEAENRLERKLEDYFYNIKESGHGLDHHKRVKAFASMIGVVENMNYEDIQLCRHAAMIHDVSKVLKKGGTEHNWEKIKELAENLMKEAKIDERYRPKVISIIAEHDKDNPSKRSELGNVVYEADTVDLTFLPRCFSFSEAVETANPGTYSTMDKILKDYRRFHIEKSKPLTHAGKRMFEVGKDWSLPTLDDLKNKLGERDMKTYFPFLGIWWRENVNEAPLILKETLQNYREFTPKYEKALS